jgi:hypothetical protein
MTPHCLAVSLAAFLCLFPSMQAAAADLVVAQVAPAKLGVGQYRPPDGGGRQGSL